jgi:hypothetical protein
VGPGLPRQNKPSQGYCQRNPETVFDHKFKSDLHSTVLFHAALKYNPISCFSFSRLFSRLFEVEES